MVTSIQSHVDQYGFDSAQMSGLKAVGDKIADRLDVVLDAFFGTEAAANGQAFTFATDKELRSARKLQKQHWKTLLSGAFDADYAASVAQVGAFYFVETDTPLATYMAASARAVAQLQSLCLKGMPLWSGLVGTGKASQELSLLSKAFMLDMNLVMEAFVQAQQQEQDTALQYLKDGMARMAAKDLSRPIPSSEQCDFPARFDPIRTAFNALQSEMGQVIRTIKEATHDLDLTAAEVNSGADDLARRTETQAATLEQTAVSVDDITKSVHSSSEATQDTDGMMAQTHQNAKMGQSVMSETVAKMREIADSSAQISQITGVIDDIAFQTNLLALNAGVEAARAGDAGRGFAVVAHEVRGLAQRAAESAAEISELIKASTDLVENGVVLVDQAGDVLENIVQKVESVATLTSQVATSSKEQSEGLSQISSGLTQLDSVTQQNAAMVEQTAAAVGAMQRDTTQMAALVRGFALAEAPERAQVHVFSSNRAA